MVASITRIQSLNFLPNQILIFHCGVPQLQSRNYVLNCLEASGGNCNEYIRRRKDSAIEIFR
jgi:hypothetical protein